MKTQKITKSVMMAEIKSLGLKVREKDGEIRVAVPYETHVREEANAFYTDDRQDAIDTAKAMAIEYRKTFVPAGVKPKYELKPEDRMFVVGQVTGVIATYKKEGSFTTLDGICAVLIHLTRDEISDALDYAVGRGMITRSVGNLSCLYN